MDIYGKTDIGQLRESNQDAMQCGMLSERAGFAVVCDGMGGTNGGNIASDITVQIVTQRIQSQYRDGMSQASAFNLLESAVDAANVDVFDRAVAEPELNGMGTTLVAVIVDNGQVTVAHVGDSRLYRLRGNTCEQMTTDHSIVQEMVDKGQLTTEQARTHPRKHFITRAIGVEETVRCDFDTFTLQADERLLLCTDGLSNMLSDATMGEISAKTLLRQLPDALIEAANTAGGEDNITAVVIA